MAARVSISAMVTSALILGFLGLCLGSFVNAFTWRLMKGKDWVKARSQCVHCGHELAAKDLVPVLSWLVLHGRCRYCGKPISKQYPLIELAMAAVFVLSYLYWPESLAASGQKMLLVTWLAASVSLMALAVYDFHTKLLPNKLVYLTLVVAAAGRLSYIIWFSSDRITALWQWAASVAVAAGIFGLIYIASRGRLIGLGDVRLGLATGTLLATPFNSFLMIFIASLLGTFFALPGLLRQSKNFKTELPYGPFLISATFLVVLFGPSISTWYQTLITP